MGAPLDAPDGGYGWVVVVAYSLNTIVVLQIIGVFGLIFKDLFAELHLPTTDIALILNLNMSVSLLMGIFTNTVIRRFGCRKMGAVGAVLASTGMLLTAFSSSAAALLFNFGVVMASGLGLSTPAFTVALNSYFRARRSLATGLAMGLTGVSAILLPQLVGLLLSEYGARGACVLFAGLALNGVVAAALLQPVAWHRPAPRKGAAPALETPSVHEHEDDPMVDREFALPALPVLKVEDGEDDGVRQRTASTTSTYYTARCQSSNSIWASSNVLDMGSSVITLNYPILEEETAAPGLLEVVHKAVDKEGTVEAGAARRCCSKCCTFLVDVFDLGLLSNPSILNLMLCVSVASFVEMNFTVFLPFILAERGLDTASIANALSVIAMANTALRLLAPLAQVLLGWSSKTLYILSLLLMVAGRAALVMLSSDSGVLAVALVLGTSKGFRSVFYHMIIPDNVPPERLAAAIGLQAVLNGVIFLASGPIIGYIRDESGSYDVVIMVLNGITLLCIAMWGMEYLVCAVRARRAQRKKHAAPWT